MRPDEAFFGPHQAQQGGQAVAISLLEARKWALAELTAAGLDQDEATAQVDFLLTGYLQVNYGMLRANLTRQMPPWLAERWPKAIAALVQGRPVQYVLGQAPFYEDEFLVDERVLIPRPETEGLVDWVLTDARSGANALLAAKNQPARLVDVGTGSGAIALSLAKQLSTVAVTGVDLSEAALAVAAENRTKLGLTDRVALQQSDLLTAFTAEQDRFTVIVANPPYISRDALAEMDERVWRYEPDTALFAAENGLALYRQLAQQLPAYLTADGCAYFEIGYDQGPALKALFQSALPTAEITLRKDFAGLDRMIRVTLHGNKRTDN
ncbi:peptide chain release factor N(5)-glutamine methyltransferase [Leuconostocaceae bacterium ESL0958]|nr:peptide chain release factor N(5)-glutamine methyltransferase [Leuconostocaceae bacterium ESL0958]